jgi:phage shock protein A
MMDDQIKRLDRIEEKLDKVGEAIISLARMEERMITLFKRMDMYDQQQQALESRVANIEVKSASSEWIERVVWLVVGAAVVYFIGGK